jgi:hypothetical protein
MPRDESLTAAPHIDTARDFLELLTVEDVAALLKVSKSGATDCGLARAGEAHGARSADVRDLVRKADLAEQRRASVDRSGLQDVRTTTRAWLTLRRTYSSWAHEKGVPGKVIAQLMGHAKVDTTLNVYTQVIDGSLRRAADTVGSELFTIVHKPEKASELTH